MYCIVEISGEPFKRHVNYVSNFRVEGDFVVFTYNNGLKLYFPKDKVISIEV